MQYPQDGGSPASDAARLQAALEALAARDQVLADRTRRLAALEDCAARLAAVAARLEAAEEELASLRLARQAQAAEREARLTELEIRLAADHPSHHEAPPEPAPGASVEPSGPPGVEAVVARLQSDLEAERRRNFRFRLVERVPASDPSEAPSLRESLEEARCRAAMLERELAELRTGPGGLSPYAHWEAWFRRQLAERGAAERARAEETIRDQHAVLEEKERLITTLVDRLRAAGEVEEGPDDLKEIVGIGPVIEDLLHGLGITSFEQLAALSAEELDRIGDRLGAFHERIRRDRWTEQAADLAHRRVRLGPGLSLR